MAYGTKGKPSISLVREFGIIGQCAGVCARTGESLVKRGDQRYIRRWYPAHRDYQGRWRQAAWRIELACQECAGTGEEKV